MRKFCIYCPELEDRVNVRKEHFKDVGISAEFIAGIHGESFGVLCTKPHNVDPARLGYVSGYRHTGLFLSHYMIWTLCSVLPDPYFMIIEDDAEFHRDWLGLTGKALHECPNDMDILLLGSSNTEDKDKQQITEMIWEVKYPFCTHAYIVSKKAIPVLLSRMRDASMAIDLGLIELAYPHLRVYTVLPRLVNQRDTVLTP